MLCSPALNSQAQFVGQLVSATAQSPITLGQGLNITVTIQNTSDDIWIAGDEGFSWYTDFVSTSWGGTVDYIFYTTRTVNLEATDSMTMTLEPTDLPSSPGSYSVDVVTVCNYMDIGYPLPMNGSPKTVSFTITTASVNHSPIITPIGTKTIVESNLLSFQVSASDTDTPQQVLTFSVLAGAPSGASISPSGLFSWTPPAGYAPRTNQISVCVTDNGSPAMSATNIFDVVVLSPLRFLPIPKPVNNVVRLSWESYPGKIYRVRYRDTVNTGTWNTFGNDITATGSTTSATNNVGSARQRYYQLLMLN